MNVQRWDDLVTLFGRGGANSGCWCMWWRLRAKDWSAGAGAAAHDPIAREQGRVRGSRRPAGEPTGLLAYDDGVPVGWCVRWRRGRSYSRLLRSDDDRATRSGRGRGVVGELLFHQALASRSPDSDARCSPPAVGVGDRAGRHPSSRATRSRTDGVRRNVPADYFTGTVGPIQSSRVRTGATLVRPAAVVVMRRAVGAGNSV